MILRPAKSTLCPYPTLFRSGEGAIGRDRAFEGLPDAREGAAPPHPLLVRHPRAVAEDEGHAGRPVVLEGDLQLRSEEHTSELQSRQYLVCRLLLEKKNTNSS